MKKKKLGRKQPQDSTPPPPQPPEGATLDDVLELVRRGHITLAGTDVDGESFLDVVLVPVSDEMHVPLDVDAETQLAEDRLLIEQGMLPARLQKELHNDAAALWEHFKRFSLRPVIEAATGQSFEDVWRSISNCDPNTVGKAFAEDMMMAGFDAALVRYAPQLKNVPELAAWHRKRRQGVDKGHATQSQAREKRYQLIRERWAAMEAAGEKVTNDTVAEAMRKDGWKCSRSTVIRAFKSKPAKQNGR